ncbi:MAG: bifunctional diguanylate cyclase/phosphodiesterase [Defluviitaleaceae bacterium]|nr:bifunctional diguanylate cyclase/phosphodiesterase [Defluviitaleaceae bacterium]
MNIDTGSVESFLYNAYQNMLPDFIGAFATQKEAHIDDFETLSVGIVTLFEHVLELKKTSASVAVLWFSTIDYDKKLEVSHFVSEKFTSLKFSNVLDPLCEHFFNLPQYTPLTFNSAELKEVCNVSEDSQNAEEIPHCTLVVPISFSEMVYGYALVFYHAAEITPPTDKIDFLYSVMRSASLIRRIDMDEKRFDKYLMNDQQTELPNRAYLYESLVNLLQMSELYPLRFALLTIRVNGLKHINNSLGIITGDLLLKEVGLLIKAAIAQQELDLDVIVGRLNGVDFGVIMMFPLDGEEEPPSTEKIDLQTTKEYAIVQTCCNAIIEKANDHVDINNHQLYLSANIGASIFPFHGETAEELLRKADLAKATAKQSGFNSYKIYEDLMDSDAENILFLNNNLPVAIASNQFELFYQAQVDVKSGIIVGTEALIRWRHPDKGIIFPGDFIPFADENNYSIQLDSIVLAMACVQINKWRQEGFDLTVSVNISPKHFDNGLICDTVHTMLKDNSSISASNIKIELLESVLLDDFDFTVKVINDLRRVGINVALDDFGSGYSSLEYVAKLPMDYLKIDRTFLMNLEKNPSNKIILETIMTLSRGMKVKTIAEGVETAEHYSFLKTIGCDLAQGYYINRPLPADEFEKLLKQNKATPFQ